MGWWPAFACVYCGSRHWQCRCDRLLSRTTPPAAIHPTRRHPPHPPSRRHELLTWQLPWGAANPWQLASRVMAGERLEVPPREALPGPDTPGWAGLDGYVALMQHCWAQAPEDRPSFQDIVVALRWVVGGGWWVGGCKAGWGRHKPVPPHAPLRQH